MKLASRGLKPQNVRLQTMIINIKEAGTSRIWCFLMVDHDSKLYIDSRYIEAYKELALEGGKMPCILLPFHGIESK